MKKLCLFLLVVVASLPLLAQTDAVYWEPATVTQGSSVDIYYNTITGTLPDNAGQVLIHLGINGWTDIDDYPMASQGEGWWMFHYEIPEIADVIDFVFQDGQGNWDNHGGEGIDWHIGVDVPGLWEPLFPGPNDTIRISIQNPVAGNLWWGVNSWNEPLDVYQPENTVIGSAGQSVESDLNGPDSNGTSWVEIGPFNKSYQVVEMVDFVFHYDDGSWDNNGGADYHMPLIFEPGVDDPSISMTNIEENQVLEIQQLIQVTSENAIFIELLLDGSTRHIVGSGGDFDFTLNTENATMGPHQLVAFARRDNQRVMMDIKTVWKMPEVIEEALPAGEALGAHEKLDGTVTFALLAPGKQFISLVGDFNGWNPDSTLLKLDPVQDIYWINMPLEAGTYEYQYLIDGTKLIGDPFSTDVNWTDSNGDENWQPQNQRSVLEVGGQDFPWTDDAYVRPAMKDLIIYELLIRDFSPSRDIQGLTEKLSYLSELGINSIELMPPTEFPGANSWGYNPAFFMAFESAYGTPEDFKNFVNEAHALGISVIVDLVFNHADGSSPYEQMYGDDYENSPYMHAEANAWGFPDFDHNRVGTRALTAATVRHWIREYHVDGYRYDHTPGIGWSGASEFGVSYFSNQAFEEDNEVYQIAEHFASDVGNLINVTHINSHWHDAFHDQMKANLRQGSFEGSYYGDMDKTERGINFWADGFQDGETCVNYLESHDEQRVIFEAQTNGLTYAQALVKAELAAQVLFTSTGIPMFFMGAELGMNTERTLDYNPVRWYYLDLPAQAQLRENYKRLIWLRNNYAALRSNNINVVQKSDIQKTLVHQRTLDGHPGVLVAMNFSTQDQTLDLEFPWAGIWYEFTQDDTIQIESNWFGSYTLPASSARIFTSERLWVGIDKTAQPPVEFALHPAYPNPFNPSTTLRFDNPEPSIVSLKIYDVRGREIWSQSEEPQHMTAGSHEVIWSGVDHFNQPVATGIYFVELRTPEFHQVQKLMLMK